jgi:DNA damage-binding protein 1
MSCQQRLAELASATPAAACTAAGRTTSTTCMAYLDSGYVFLGSRGGDSQLIRLHETPLPPQQPPQADPAAAVAPTPTPTAAAGASAVADDPMGVTAAAGSSEAAAAASAGGDDGPNYVEVVDSWPSLAPILDFAVVDLERQGQGQVGG